MRSAGLRRWVVLGALLAAAAGLLLFADGTGSTPLRWAAGTVTSVVVAGAMVAASDWAPRLGVGLAISVTTASGLLVAVVPLTLLGLWPGSGRDVRSWDQPAASVLWAAVTLLAVGAGAVVAHRALRGSLRPASATALALVLALAAVIGAGMLLGSVATFPRIEVDAARSAAAETDPRGSTPLVRLGSARGGGGR